MTNRPPVQRAVPSATHDTDDQRIPRESHVRKASASLTATIASVATLSSARQDPSQLPMLLTVDEMATLLRTSRKAIYVMAERRQLPGVTRLGRRILFRTSVLLDWLDHNRASSPKE